MNHLAVNRKKIKNNSTNRVVIVVIGFNACTRLIGLKYTSSKLDYISILNGY